MMGAVVAVLLLIGAALILMWLGYRAAEDHLGRERAELAGRRAALDAEWRALDDTRRVRDIFLSARRAMRTEEWRQRRQ